MKIKSLILISALFSSAVFAAPSDKSLEELSKITPYEAFFYENIKQPILIERAQLIQGLAQDSTLTDEERKKVLQIYDTYSDGLLKSLDTPQVKIALKQAYLKSAKNFTQGEVDAQIAFYGSTDGKNALEKQSDVFGSYLQSAMDANKSIIDSYSNKHSKKMNDELKKILNKK